MPLPADFLALLNQLPSHYAETLNAVADAQQRAAASETKAEALARQLQDMTVALAHVNQDVAALRAETARLYNVAAEVFPLREKLAQSQANLSEAQAEMEQLNAATAALNGYKEDHDRKVSALTAQLETVQRALDAATTAADAAWVENASLKKQVTEATSKRVAALEAENKHLQDVAAHWQTLCHEKEARVAEVTTQRDALVAQAVDAEQYRQQVEALKREVAAGWEAIQGGQALVDKLRADLDTVTRQIDIHKTDAEKAWAELAQTKKDRAQLAQSLNAAMQEHTATQVALREQQAENGRLTLELQTLLADKTSSLERAEAQIAALRSDLQTARQVQEQHRMDADQAQETQQRLSAQMTRTVEAISQAVFGTPRRNADEILVGVKALANTAQTATADVERVKQALAKAEAQIETLKKFRA